MEMTTLPKIVALLINSITSLIEVLLSFRVILKLFGASVAAPFVSWVYETTQPLLSPFIGMFPSPKLPEGLVIEFSALFALIVYAFIGYLTMEFLETIIYYGGQRVRNDKKSK